MSLDWRAASFDAALRAAPQSLPRRRPGMTFFLKAIIDLLSSWGAPRQGRGASRRTHAAHAADRFTSS